MATKANEMQLFLKKISFFLILILLVWLVLECFYRFVPNTYTEKHKNIQKRYKNTEVLIFGNSHTFYGLNPDYFDENAFNLANISQTIYFDKLLFDKHIDHFKNLEWVILNIEYTSLSQKDNTSEDLWRKYFYRAQMDLDVPLIPFYDIRQYSLSSNRTFKQSLNTIGKYFKNGTIAECTELGWGNTYWYEKRFENLSELAQYTIKKHEDGLTDFSLNSKRIQDIISVCQEKNIKVLLVTMPVHKSYAKGVNQEKLQKIFATAQSLSATNKNSFYLNLFQNEHFSDDDFFDPDHLNNKGAEKCSKIINAFIL